MDGTERVSTTGPADAKQRLRRWIRARQGELTARLAAAAGEAVALRLLRALDPARAERWILYASLRDELPLRPLFEQLRARGRVTLLPRVRASRLEFAVVQRWSDLDRGPYGILQPHAALPALALRAADVVVVPGLAFDRAGHRLGRGRGYYDRALAAASSPPVTIGAGYAWQVVERVPHDSRDRRVDAIVTERALTWSRGRR